MLFRFSQYDYIAKRLRALPSLEQGQFSIKRYDNQELHAIEQDPVAGRPCSILDLLRPLTNSLFHLCCWLTR